MIKAEYRTCKHLCGPRHSHSLLSLRPDSGLVLISTVSAIPLKETTGHAGRMAAIPAFAKGYKNDS